jgi:hypothetical protein
MGGLDLSVDHTLAAKGTAAIIGEAEGGWFRLPPWSLWQPWARERLEIAAKRSR